MNDPLTGGPIDPCELDETTATQSSSGLVWTTKDGRKLALSEMTDDHLRNAAAMCRRKAEAESELAGMCWSHFGLNGEMAQMAAEHEGDDHSDRAGVLLAWAMALETELGRRGVAA